MDNTTPPREKHAVKITKPVKPSGSTITVDDFRSMVKPEPSKLDWLGYGNGERLEARVGTNVLASSDKFNVMMQRWLDEGADEQPYHNMAAVGNLSGYGKIEKTT